MWRSMNRHWKRVKSHSMILPNCLQTMQERWHSKSLRYWRPKTKAWWRSMNRPTKLDWWHSRNRLNCRRMKLDSWRWTIHHCFHRNWLVT
jgi:hypothetical protein